VALDWKYYRTVITRLLTFAVIGGSIGGAGGLILGLVLHAFGNVPKGMSIFLVIVFATAYVFSAVYQSWPVIVQGRFRWWAQRATGVDRVDSRRPPRE
jgi:hypothetical protein